MKNNNHKFFIYARKSSESEEQQVRSIGDQVAELRDIVHKDGLTIIDVLAESQSAKTKGRPIFNEMLARIEAGEANAILAWHPDRLARNAFDGGRIIDLIDEGKIRDLRFCTFWFEPTAQGKMMLNFAFGQSKYYSDNLSDNVKRAQRRKVSEGIWAWQAPVGYLNEPKLRTIVVDPIKGPLMRQMFELYATGHYSFEHLREIMTERGLRGVKNLPMSLSRFQDSLNNPFYYGYFILHGELHQASHEPLVTKELYDQCQAVMRRRGRVESPRMKPYAYRGLLQCGQCGATITMETQKGHNYLRCTKRLVRCPQKYLREEKLTEQIASLLASLSLPDDIADWMVEEVRLQREKESGASSNLRQATENDIKKLDGQVDRLTAAYLDQAAFTPEEFRQRKNNLLNTKQQLIEKLKKLESDDVARFEPLIRFINRSKQTKYVARRSDPKELRAELEKTGSNLKLLNQKLEWEPRGAWKLVVAQGSMAHRHTAPEISGAVCDGKSRVVPNECPGQDSNLHALRHYHLKVARLPISPPGL